MKEQDEKIRGLEAQLEEVEHHLAHIRQYTINWFKDLLKKYGKGRERKTKIDTFEQVVASEVIINNQKLYVNRDDGFAGFGMKKDEFVSECSDLDEILVIRGDGTMIVTKVDDKKYVGKDVRYISVFRKSEPEPVFNLIYQDGRGGNIMVKRFTVGGTTRDKEYVLTKGNDGSKILYLSAMPNESGETVRVILRPKPKLRITQLDVDFNQFEVKGRGTIGNILTKNSVQRVTKIAEAPATPPAKQLTIPAGESKAGKAEATKPATKSAAAKKPAPVVKGKSPSKAPKKAPPLNAESAVTVEWDLSAGSTNTRSDRARILEEIEEKTEKRKKNQMKMDF